jgi:hypothetical protein
MGSETTKALHGRRRQSAARTNRLINRVDDGDPIGAARRARTGAAVRTARRKLRVLADAQDAVTRLELEVGRLLRWLVGQGMSRNDAFELVGLRRHLGRRYLDRAERAQATLSTALSTDPPGIAESCPAENQRGPDGDRRPGDTTPGRES